MNTFEKLDKYLSKENYETLWHDEAINHARELARNMQEPDWKTAKFIWKLRPEEWQEKFANILDYGDPNYVVPILLEMCQSPYSMVVLFAAEALRDIEIENLNINDDVVQRLKEVAEESSMKRIVINMLLEKLYKSKKSF